MCDLLVNKITTKHNVYTIYLILIIMKHWSFVSLSAQLGANGRKPKTKFWITQ